MDCSIEDSFLPAGDFERLRRFLHDLTWFSVTTSGKRGPDGRMDDLLRRPDLKLLGGRFVVMKSSPDLETDKTAYPSGTPLDAVLERVRERLPRFTLLGCGPRAYPPGRGMDLHDDARFAATFVLYAHEDWRPEWDGALVFESGAVIEPQPNRCVLIKAGAPHRVRPGLRPRLSVIGYDFVPKAR